MRQTAPIAAFALAVFAAGGAGASSSTWERHEFSRARLVSAVEAVGQLREIRLGLQIRMQPGWKTYWRSPGEAGAPAQIDWTGSRNLASAEILWPVPERHTLLGIETLGYEGEPLLPIVAQPSVPGEPVKLRATVDYLVCEKICVPVRASFALDLGQGAAAPSPFVDLIDRARARVPGDGRAAGLVIADAGLSGDGHRLIVRATAREPFEKPDLFVEAPIGVFAGAPRAALSADRLSATLTAPLGVAKDAPGLAGKEVVLTLVDGVRAVETRRTVAGSAAGGGANATGLAAMLALALLGGLILNLMPCVLPVLSLKLLAVMGHGGGEAGAVRLGFLASAAGILASFVLLAGGLLAVKQAGVAVGWGIQFQQPLFIAFMAVVIALFACNLFGWFEIAMPRWVGVAAAREATVHGMAGHFLAGALATLLATPCSAPFLGTAVSFAVSRGPAEILLIFVALGLGLALPYLAVAAVPALVLSLPRPGPWMVHLRRLLGLALAGTAVWLVTVLAAQKGAAAAAGAGAVLAAMALVLAFGARRAEGMRRAAKAASLAFGAVVLGVAAWAPVPSASVVAKADESHWRKFDVAAIAGLMAQGKTVFVDVTADWCVTCQANKALVLTRGEVARRLAGDGVIAMRADWTRPNPAIAEYLASFGRYGIPFNAVYGPQAPRGIPLPELLTSEAVLAALDQAAAGTPRVVGTPFR